MMFLGESIQLATARMVLSIHDPILAPRLSHIWTTSPLVPPSSRDQLPSPSQQYYVAGFAMLHEKPIPNAYLDVV